MTINKADIKHTRQEQTKNIIDPNIKEPQYDWMEQINNFTRETL